MDDYNISVLSEAKNEYSLRLITTLCPLILEGLKSILKEAWELCLSNNEEEKYLMTFQNFLSRVTKWNQTIIEEETARIVEKSDCPYLEDLLTCVHITQLKILTSIRVSQRQKKIELDIPKLSDFIHKVYIQCARKFYSTVYLFEQQIPPLQYQKNMRECETICRECILTVIRNNMPVEHIIRTYMDESIEEEFIEEDEVTDVSVNTMDVSSNDTVKIVNNELTEVIKVKTDKEPQVASEDNEPKQETKEASKPEVEASKPEVEASKPEVETKELLKEEAIKETIVEKADESENVIITDEALELPPPPDMVTANITETTDTEINKSPTIIAGSVKTEPRHLSLTDVDKVFDGEKLSEVTAPKDIKTLEEISKKRNEQRKAEEEEEDDNDYGAIKIHNDADADIDIGVLSLDTAEELDDSVFADIEQL